MSRVKKLFSVQEDKFEKLPRDVQADLLSSQTVGGGKTSDFVQQQSVFTPLLDREILLFNDDIQSTMKKPLPTKLKALELLRKVNRFFALKQRWEEEQSKDIVAMRDTPSEEQESVSSPILTTSKSVSPSETVVRVDPKSVVSYGEREQAWGRENITKSLHARIKPRFVKILQDLEKRDGFGWDPATGEVKLNRQLIPGTDLRDLILHRVRVDLQESTHDPPPYFRKFNLFLKRRNITSDPPLRRKSVSVPVRTLMSKADRRDKTQTLLKKKKNKLGSGFLPY